MLKYGLAVSISLLTFIVYLPSLQNEFVNWDDNTNVYENPHIRSLNGAFFKWAFLDLSAPGSDYWRPLSYLSHAVDYAMWGLNPMGHHLTNNILHAINTFLVVLLVSQLLASWQAGKLTSRQADNLAGSHDTHFALIAATVTGLLFGLHPIHVESVAWVTERKDLLCALFYLTSIMAYIRYAADILTPSFSLNIKGIKGGYFLSLGLFALALMSKPMAVSLPIVLMILDWYPFERIKSVKTFMTAVVEKIPFIALALVSSVLTILAQKSGGAIRSLEYSPFSVRLFIAIKSLGAYLYKMLLPFNLLPYYDYPKTIHVLSLEYILPLIFVIAMTIISVVSARKQKIWLLVWGYYVITLLPVIGLLHVGGQSMADRYAYLPSLGPFLIIGLGIALIWKKSSTVRKWVATVRTVTAVMVISTFICLSYLSIEQIGKWKNSVALWTYVIEKEPKTAIAYENRAAYFYNLNQFDKALPDYDMFLFLEPFNNQAYILRTVSVEALFERGNFYLRQGNKELAVSDLTTACKFGKESACALLKGMGMTTVRPK